MVSALNFETYTYFDCIVFCLFHKDSYRLSKEFQKESIDKLKKNYIDNYVVKLSDTSNKYDVLPNPDFNQGFVNVNDTKTLSSHNENSETKQNIVRYFFSIRVNGGWVLNPPPFY